MLFDRPTARRDVEEAERQRWLQILADLLRHSPTPMGELLAAQPGNVEVLGGGKRASTLRSRVRAIRKFLQWLHLAHDIRYPPDSGALHGVPEFALVRAVQQGRTEVYASFFGVLERADRYSGSGQAHVQPVVHGHL